MGAKHFGQKSDRAVGSVAEWVGNEKMRGRVIGLLHWLAELRNLAERRGEAVGVAGQERTRCIGKKFALARNGKLYKSRDNRRKNRKDNAEE